MERPKSTTDKPAVIGRGDKGVSSLVVMAWRDFVRIAENEDHKCVLMVSKEFETAGEAGINVFGIKGRPGDQRSILTQAAITQSTAHLDGGGCGYERVMKRRLQMRAIIEHSSCIWTTRHGDGSFGFQWRRNPSRKISVIGHGEPRPVVTLDAMPCRAAPYETRREMRNAEFLKKRKLVLIAPEGKGGKHSMRPSLRSIERLHHC